MSARKKVQPKAKQNRGDSNAVDGVNATASTTNPSHYQRKMRESATFQPENPNLDGSVGVQAVDVIETFGGAVNGHRAHTFTYLLRAGSKGDTTDEIKDLKKAMWWIRRELQFRFGITPNLDE